MHKNNFDIFRLVFATLVLITHSYSLTGLPEHDFLYNMTSGQISCSSLGVKGFFIISGYLIFQSVLLSKNWVDYIIKRILRIYPAYIAVLIFAIILGFFISDLSANQYFSDHSTRAYFFSNLAMFLPLHYQIDHVFSTNVYKDAINGSIWTIPYEFLFYLILSFAFLLKKMPKALIAVLLAGYAALFLLTLKYEDHASVYIPKEVFELHLLAHLGLCFFGGAALAAIRISDSRYKLPLLITSFVFCVLFICTRTFYFTQFFILPLFIILAGTYATKGIAGLNEKIGDFSYGIYLYGFVVQQILMHYFKFNYLELMFISIPITFILGALSWHLIEKRALALKKYFP